MEETVGSARIGPRITLSQPMIESGSTGLLLGVVPADFVVPEDFVVPDDFTVLRAGWRARFVVVTRATGASTPVRTAVVFGTAGKVAGVEETEAATESALDAPPG